ncbi:MAG TPA: hypothetical protein VGD86_10525 [Devosia sp.]|jgi:hypothetical protein
MKTSTKLVLAVVLALATPVTAYAQAVGAAAPPGGPNHPPSAGSNSDPSCEYPMGYLFPVTVKQIKGIDDDWKVWVRPVCEDSPNAPVRNMGNATQLIGAIGRNDVLEAALDKERYLADDVVGVLLSKGNRVTLWVHHSLY